MDVISIVRNGLNALVAIKFISDNIKIFFGIDIINMIRAGQLNLEDIERIHLVGTLCLIPFKPDGLIENDTFNVLCELSDDFADNNKYITFWYLEDISEHFVRGVFRDSELLDAL